MLTLDGSQGEGGGQILRTALALSLITRTPFRLEKVRAARARPGLLRQHLTAVEAARQVGHAVVEGATLGSAELRFEPGATGPGDYHFSVGTAGSATLVLQAVLPALLSASGPSTVVVEGGTHNPSAPPFEFFDRAYLPLVGRMGPKVEATLERAGFYPAGGGRIRLSVEPAPSLARVALLERGPIVHCSARALVANLSYAIARREAEALCAALGWEPAHCTAQTLRDVAGPGNVVLAEVESENVREVFTGIGEKRVRAEQVAERVAREVAAYLAADVPVGAHLADQLLLLMAIAGGGSFRTVEPTRHTTTQIDVVRAFLGVQTRVTLEGGGAYRVEVG